MSKSLVEIQGFKELEAKLKLLPDKVKRTELLKVLGQVANPTLAAARRIAPISDQVHYRYVKGGKIAITPGNLRKSIKKITARRSKINPVLYVGAKAGKTPDGYYAHMVVKKGFEGKKRKGQNYDFMKEAFESTQGQVTDDAVNKVAKYIQKQIDRL